MNVYTGLYPFYCGVDLHASTMYLCILHAIHLGERDVGR